MIKTTLLTLLGLVALAIAVVAAMASQRPDTFRVLRSTSIAAPAEKIFPLSTTSGPSIPGTRMR